MSRLPDSVDSEIPTRLNMPRAAFSHPTFEEEVTAPTVAAIRAELSGIPVESKRIEYGMTGRLNVMSYNTRIGS